MADATRLIKKYPNRRLYDTETSTYITLADVKQLVLQNEKFEVVDAKSQEDLTRSILLQIILEEEGGGVPMFTSPMLAHMIRFYGNAMQGMMGTYLEKSIQSFIEIQDKMKDQLGDTTRQLYDGKGFGSELWTQFLAGQAPMMQSMMGSYMEQSKNMFMQMQDQMQNQTRSMFGNAFNFPVQAGTPAPAAAVNGTAAAPTHEKAKKHGA